MKITTFPILTINLLLHGWLIEAYLYESVVSIPGYGNVQGVQALNASVASYISNWETISFFGGIPFGASTAGQNRWKAPQPASPWNETLDASTFGPICAQSGNQIAQYGLSEDCLTVNIWTPANSTDEKLPVMIWSYGAGTATPQSQYNGAGMAAKGVIFVSYNYRAGALGFAASPELSAETGYNASGNWAILDQFAAVQWVYDNIAAFGGDPDHITAVGQSFGAAATYHMVNSDLISGLLVGAIAESGVRDPYDPNVAHYECQYQNLTYAESIGTSLLSSLNVSTIDEARQLSYETIISSGGSGMFGGMQYQPVLDYHAIPSTYLDSLTQGAGNKVPFITGNNKDEDGAGPTSNVSLSSYESSLNQTYGALASRFLELYPASNTTEASQNENDIVRDTFRVSSWLYMDSFSRSSNSNTWTYYWTHAPPGSDEAAHASEIVYALGNLFAQSGVNYTSEDYYISNAMSSYWANFVKTGDPNNGGSYRNGTLPTWEANSPMKNSTFEIGSVFEEIETTAIAKVQLILDYFFEQTAY